MPASTLQPVAKQSAESQVTDSLRNYILSGAIPPGGRLTEIALAEHLGVARATLRTGLHRLAVEGILVQIPYTGWQVAEFTSDDVWELWTLRGSLESLAAKLAAENPDPQARLAIERAWAGLMAACATGDMQQVNESDIGLHRTIIEATRHSRLQRQYQLVEQQVRLYIITCNEKTTDSPVEIIEQHRPMVEALLAGDAERAARESWLHNEREGRRFMERLKAQG